LGTNFLAVLLFPDSYPPPWITEVTQTGDEVFIAWSDVRMTADKYHGYSKWWVIP
jgi:hypothetical protein